MYCILKGTTALCVVLQVQTVDSVLVFCLILKTDSVLTQAIKKEKF